MFRFSKLENISKYCRFNKLIRTNIDYYKT